MAEEGRPDASDADGASVSELSTEVSQQAPDEGAERLAEESTETIVEVLQQVNPSTATDLLASLPRGAAAGSPRRGAGERPPVGAQPDVPRRAASAA